MNWERGLFRACIFLSVIGLIVLHGAVGGTSGICSERPYETWAIAFDCYWIRHDKIWAFWVFFTAVLFSIRWVILGFKKTASARNWPEGPDE